jgi:hypothetical protein
MRSNISKLHRIWPPAQYGESLSSGAFLGQWKNLGEGENLVETCFWKLGWILFSFYPHVTDYDMLLHCASGGDIEE